MGLPRGSTGSIRLWIAMECIGESKRFEPRMNCWQISVKESCINRLGTPVAVQRPNLESVGGWAGVYVFRSLYMKNMDELSG